MAKRVSLAGADAMKSGFGIQEGTVRVEDARFKTVQHVKGDGTLVTPFTALQFDVCKLNAAGDAETEVEVKDFIVGWGSKEQTENGQHKFKFRPGVVANATADEVEDRVTRAPRRARSVRKGIHSVRRAVAPRSRTVTRCC